MNTVTGLFTSRHGAERAVCSLIRAGFEREEISVSDVGEPLFRASRGDDAEGLSEKRTDKTRTSLSFFGGVVGAIAGALLLPFLLSLEITLAPRGTPALAMAVGAFLGFVFASRVASLLVADATLDFGRGAEMVAAPTIVGVRTLDAFARRAARILTRAGGAAVGTDSF